MLSLLGHDRGIGSNAGFEERGLDELALSTPKRALARHKSVSKHRFERPRPKVLDVVLGIRHQHLLDKIRPARQEHTPLTNAEARKWTIIAGGLEQEIEQPRAELAKVATKQSALWPRR